MRSTFHAFWVVAVAAATTGCYPIWLGNRLEDRVDALDNATFENRQHLDETRRQAQQLEETLETWNRSATRTTAEVAAATDELLREVQRLRGQLEEVTYRFDDVSRRFEVLERQLAALGGEEALRELEAKREVAQVERPQEKEAFFRLAKSELEKGNHVQARTLFEEFIANPNWKYDDLAPQAQLLIGDSFYAEKDYRAAIFAYQKARETWPRSRHLPDALYKLGISFDALGRKEEAIAFLQEAAKFSGQDAGKKAKAKLNELQKRR